MGAPAKFLFDTDFGHEASAARVDLKMMIAEAEARGYASGMAAGENALKDTERRTAAALTRIAAALDETSRGLKAVEERLQGEAVAVAVAAARKLAPALIAREPFAEIQALMAECFGQLVSAPHVVIRVNDALYEQACARLRAIADASGFGGRLVILADPEIETGDCRLEWADGGVARDRAKVEAAIDDAVKRFIGARSGNATIPEGMPS
ncbi:MAG: FliH/SctL family protein [Variibacter sp.]